MKAIEHLPFAALNLRRNPFGEVPPNERSALVVVRGIDLDAIAARLVRPGFALQLVGDMGRGKSTLLRAIRDRFFRDAPITYLPEDAPLPSIPEASVVFVDESQRLSMRARRRLFRRRASFVLATHEDHASELSAAGVDVWTHPIGGLDADHLARIVARRMEWARRGPGSLPEVPAEVLHTMLDRHGDDLRAIEDDLYFWLQRRRDQAWARAI